MTYFYYFKSIKVRFFFKKKSMIRVFLLVGKKRSSKCIIGRGEGGVLGWGRKKKNERQEILISNSTYIDKLFFW